MRHLDLFSGIGGFALAAESVWGEVEHTFCEIDPFCQEVIKKHWGGSFCYSDIRSLTYTKECERQLAMEWKPDQKIGASFETDLLTGGFPCQPFSQAGQRKGTADDRHLWPEMLRVIREFHPRWIIGENVSGFVTWNNGMVLEQVHADLEGEGYSVQAFVIPAVAVNAPHRRDRVWIVAHANSSEYRGVRGPEGEKEGISRIGRETRHIRRIGRADKTHNASHSGTTDDFGRRGSSKRNSARLETHKQTGKGSRGESARRSENYWHEDWSTVATRLCTLDDGLPAGMVRPKGWRNAALKAAGNAIVPQVAEEIMRGIKDAEASL